MTAEEWKLIGITLIVCGVIFGAASQILLTVWHRRTLNEL